MCLEVKSELTPSVLWASLEVSKSSTRLTLQKQFRSDTGFLPLSFTGKVDCFHDTSTRMIAQLHGIFTRSLCPVHGYYGAFEGQHLVSRRRIRSQDLGIWKHLLVRSYPSPNKIAGSLHPQRVAVREGIG